jgi:hypothetical protein
MSAFTVVPFTTTATDVPLSVVLWNAAVAVDRLAGPSPLPFTTNTEPCAMGALGNPCVMLLAAFCTLVMVGAAERCAIARAAITRDDSSLCIRFLLDTA